MGASVPWSLCSAQFGTAFPGTTNETKNFISRMGAALGLGDRRAFSNATATARWKSRRGS